MKKNKQKKTNSSDIFQKNVSSQDISAYEIWRTGPSVFLVVQLNFYLFKAVKQFFRKQKCIQKNQ